MQTCEKIPLCLAPPPPNSKRELGLVEAVSANMLEMIGVGPFITIPLLLSTMNGPQAMLGWLLGAIVAICDGLVWAELGAAMPGSGAPIVTCRKPTARTAWGN